jgi:hypothetical protein
MLNDVQRYRDAYQTMRIGKTSPVFAKRADQGRDVKSGAG